MKWFIRLPMKLSVILCNVGNFYMDMAYTAGILEMSAGPISAGYVDEVVTFYTPQHLSSIAYDERDSADFDKARKGKTDGSQKIPKRAQLFWVSKDQLAVSVEYLLSRNHDCRAWLEMLIRHGKNCEVQNNKLS